jgi:cobalt-zinc-cadmium efflux system membrane fusion protein
MPLAKNFLSNIRMKKLLVGSLFLSSVVLGLQSCDKKKEKAEDAAFMLSDTMMSKIVLDTVRTEPVRNEITVVGKVIPDENKVINVFPLVGGNVEDVKAELGDYVKKGQTLAIIRSVEVADFERQMIQAKSDLLVAQKNLASTQELFESKLSPEREVIMARKDVDGAQAELDRVKEIFEIYDLNKGSFYKVKAPIDGFIIQKNVNRGMQLRSDNNESLFTVGQISDVWVMANVSESDIPRIKPGMPANVRTISYPYQVFKGTVDKIYNVLDPETKAMHIRIRLANVGFKLKPEMHATVTLSYEEGQSMTVIPSKSVIFDRSKYWVMVFNSRSNIEARPIDVHSTLTNTTYVQDGLKDGETIISSNQLLIYNALND